jgi:hypothetical protein
MNTGIPTGKLLPFINEQPIKQIVDISEVVIKCLAIHSTAIHDFLYGNLIQGVFRHQLLQGFGQCQLSHLRHGYSFPASSCI